MSETLAMLPDDDALWRRLVSRMNDSGVISDEDEAWLTPSGIKEQWPRIEGQFRKLGYHGGSLSHHVFSRPDEGWVSIVYDTKRFDAPREAEHAWEKLFEERWKQRVVRRVDDWISRLQTLRSQLQVWLGDAGDSRLALRDRGSVQMREELMVRFGVASREMPCFEIVRGDRAVLRVQPKGLWIIGGNGRVDLIAAASSFILVDMSQSLAESSDWQVYHADTKRKVEPFTREFFTALVGAEAPT